MSDDEMTPAEIAEQDQLVADARTKLGALITMRYVQNRMHGHDDHSTCDDLNGAMTGIMLDLSRMEALTLITEAISALAALFHEKVSADPSWRPESLADVMGVKLNADT